MIEEVEKVKKGQKGKEHIDFCTSDPYAHFEWKKGVWLDNREMAFQLTTDGVQLFTLGQFTIRNRLLTLR